MLDILVRLEAIKSFAKDIHYTANGDEFYGIHLMMDRIAGGLDDFSDAIKETVYLGNNALPPSSKEILKYSLAYIPDIMSVRENLLALRILIGETIAALDKIEAARAENSLYDNIAQDLKLKLGLLNRTLND